MKTAIRRKTRTVYVGQVGIGGNHPIRVQSMLTADTKNTEAVIQEIADLTQAGCEIIRLTVPTKADLKNLANIRREMKARGLKAPLVADIHFTPSIAMDVVEFVEKVRINPGNFVDKKLFKTHDYTDEEYQGELQRIEEAFTPLVTKCKEFGVAMRIGTNHGSLSDRILNRYGDTPEGMVESALEFLRIAEKNNYYDIVLSMKASNVQVMVTAYRLLVKRMAEEGLQPYPLHLGVTEAGEGEDARIKSAMGIGTLLEEGIGDTIRVSLTEDAVHEIPVAYAIAAPYNAKAAIFRYAGKLESTDVPKADFPLSYKRRETRMAQAGQLIFGGKETPKVWLTYGQQGFDHAAVAKSSDPVFEGVELTPYQVNDKTIKELQKQGRELGIISPDATDLCAEDFFSKRTWIVNDENFSALEKLIQYCEKHGSHLEFCFDNLEMGYNPQWIQTIALVLKAQNFENVSWSLISQLPKSDYPFLLELLDNAGRQDPLHLRYVGEGPLLLPISSLHLGGLLIDGIGDSIQIMNQVTPYEELLSLTYGILQASRMRMSKTEYIACPSCGRTLFNLQDVTAQIKARTDHLKGVKIGIMGCIVNGPGEMADADFGYVGTGTGKISLYVGQDCVERNIPEANAVDSLIALIKSNGRWIDASQKS